MTINMTDEQKCARTWEDIRPIGGAFWHELDERTRHLAIACFKAGKALQSSNDEGVTDEMVERVARALWERLTCSFTFDEAREAKHPQYDWIIGNARAALEAALSTKPGAGNGVMARSKEGGFVEFLNADRPVVVHDIEGPVAILRDMETREIIGYRVYEYTPPTPASGEQMEVVEQIKGELLWAFKKWQHSHTAEELVQTILESPALSKALVTLTAANERAERAEKEAKRLKEKNRDLHRRAQSHESEQAALLRETGYFEQKRLADMWSRQWKAEFDRLGRAFQEAKAIYEICAKSLGTPYGRYNSVNDLTCGRSGEYALWAKVIVPDGIETFDIREMVQRLSDRAQAAEALNTTLSEALERLENDGKEFLEAAEAVFDWMNGNDLSADHEEQKPDDFKRVSEALVAFRTALAALPAKQGGQS